MKILVASDLSARSDRAVRRAFAIAARTGAEVEALCIVDGDLPDRLSAKLAEESKQELTRFCASLPESGSVTCSTRIESGDPASAILAAAEAAEADLLVLGLHRRRPLADLVSATTMERIVRNSLRPVLLAAEPAETPYASVLAGLDLSPASAAAVRIARTIAPEAKLSTFHAVHIPYRGFNAGDPKQAALPFMKLARQDLDRWVAAEDLSDACADAELREGGVQEVFSEMMRERKPQLVAIGAHGRGAFSAAALGGFASELLRDPPCDLLLVRR